MLFFCSSHPRFDWVENAFALELCFTVRVFWFLFMFSSNLLGAWSIMKRFPWWYSNLHLRALCTKLNLAKIQTFVFSKIWVKPNNLLGNVKSFVGIWWQVAPSFLFMVLTSLHILNYSTRKPIPFDDLKRLGIPPPPEGRYMSRFQVLFFLPY